MILAVYLWFSTYTNQISLTCSRQNNLCTIKQTNLYGHNKYKSFELSSVIRAEHNIMSISRRYRRVTAAVTRPFSAVHEFVILQKDNNSIKVYSVESSGRYNLSDIDDINNNVLEFNNFINNNKIEQVTIEKS
ncbi:hypothetical protein HDR58_05665 [bacterium]|nr:hypothetical protein [bacterium]